MQKAILLYTDDPNSLRFHVVANYLMNIGYFEIVQQQTLDTSFETTEAGIELLTILLTDKIQKHMDAIEAVLSACPDIPKLIIYSEALKLNDIKNVYKSKPLAFFAQIVNLKICNIVKRI